MLTDSALAVVHNIDGTAGRMDHLGGHVVRVINQAALNHVHGVGNIGSVLLVAAGIVSVVMRGRTVRKVFDFYTWPTSDVFLLLRSHKYTSSRLSIVR
jgi:hypothetical protein